MDAIIYVWDTIQSGVTGNAAYDALKKVLGKLFDRIAIYVKNNDWEKFELSLISAMEGNEKILEAINNINSSSKLYINHHEGIGDIVNRDKIININQGREFNISLEDAFLSLKQMPGRLQEAADAGVTFFSFKEAREKLEKLLSVSKATGNHDVVSKIYEFEKIFNDWVKIINDAISGKCTIEEVNAYHKEMIMGWFINNIYLRYR